SPSPTHLHSFPTRRFPISFNRAAEEIAGRSAPETIGRPWTALFGDSVPLPEIEATIERNPRASTRHETLLRRPDGTAEQRLVPRDRKSTRLNSSHVAISYA